MKNVKELVEDLESIANDCICGDLNINDLPSYVLHYAQAIKNSFDESVRLTLEVSHELLGEITKEQQKAAYWEELCHFWETEIERTNEHVSLLIEVLKGGETNKMEDDDNGK